MTHQRFGHGPVVYYLPLCVRPMRQPSAASSRPRPLDPRLRRLPAGPGGKNNIRSQGTVMGTGERDKYLDDLRLA